MGPDRRLRARPRQDVASVIFAAGVTSWYAQSLDPADEQDEQRAFEAG
jgi:hypothetical protein